MTASGRIYHFAENQIQFKTDLIQNDSVAGVGIILKRALN